MQNQGKRAVGIDEKLQMMLDRLSGVKRFQNGFMAYCPSHSDQRSQSLGIRIGRNGGIIFNCFAGCDRQEILASVGLTFTDLFPDRIDINYHNGHNKYDDKKSDKGFSRNELFQLLIAENTIIHIALCDVLNGKKLNRESKLRIKQAMITITNIKSEVQNG